MIETISNMINNQNDRIDVNLLNQIIFVLNISVQVILSENPISDSTKFIIVSYNYNLFIEILNLETV